MNQITGTNKPRGIRHYRHKDGTDKWYDERNRLHRDGGPAVILADGTEHWMQHGKHHRIDGPAIIYPDGRIRWCIDDEPINNRNRFQQLAKLSNEELAILILKYGNIE